MKTAPIKAADIDSRLPTTYMLPTARAVPYVSMIVDAAQAADIDPVVLLEVGYQESRYRQDIITGATRSPVGAVGMMQFMRATAKEWNVDPLDPVSAANGAARYIAWLLKRTGSYRDALAAYNWGIGNIERKGYERAPLETRQYIGGIFSRAANGRVYLR